MMRNLPLFITAALVFTIGWAAGSRSGSAPEASTSQEGEVASCPEARNERGSGIARVSSDRLGLNASSIAVADEKTALARPSLEGYLASVPFSDLKRVYLERQDEEFAR